MYAVIRQGGHQYRVVPGETFQVEKIETESKELSFDDVLAVHDGNNLHLGEPTVAGASVAVKVVRQGLGRKVDIYTFRRRKGASRRKGHRQPFTEVRVVAINLNGKQLA